MEMINNEAADIAMAPQLGSFQVVALNIPKILCFKILSVVFPFLFMKNKLSFFCKIQFLWGFVCLLKLYVFSNNRNSTFFYSFKTIRSLSIDFRENFSKFFEFSNRQNNINQYLRS